MIRGPVVVIDEPIPEEPAADRLRVPIGYPGALGGEVDLRGDRRVRAARAAGGRLTKGP